jgi:hypothetical protein
MRKMSQYESQILLSSPEQRDRERFFKFVFLNRRFFCRVIIWLSAILIIASCLIRYFQFPTFWLDEAGVALPLKDPSLQNIFTRFDMGLYFPRLYMCVIALFREIFGYKIWTLRLLPTLCFIIGTCFWLRLLSKRSGSFISLNILSGVIVLGSSFWLEQSIQLKQYTFDVVLALIPFLANDALFDNALAEGKSRFKLIALAMPCALSYTYPFALLARVLGWYLYQGRRKTWRLSLAAVLTLALAILMALTSIWLTDHRYNLRDHNVYLGIWNDCIIHISDHPAASLRIIANFLWGWHHGRLLPLVVAAVVPLQALGVYWTVKKLTDKKALEADSDWGSRTLGSIGLLTGMILASAVVSYPICTGRVVLFTQVHTQILILEGGLYILTFWNLRKFGQLFLFSSIAVVVVYSTHRYIGFLKEKPPENLRPILSLINPSSSQTVWVHPCSQGQVKSLPDPLPVQEVITKTKNRLPEPGQKVWILWTHLSDGLCKDSLQELRSNAKSWQVVHESVGRGLALAEY